MKEESILHYISGFVPFKLLKGCEKQSIIKLPAQFVECLSASDEPHVQQEVKHRGLLIK